MIFLMSIKPKFVRELFSGYKRFELRKVSKNPPKSGDLVILYVSGHVQAIVGEFVVGKVLRGEPSRLISLLERYKPHGLRPEHWRYVEGAREALAIEVLNARPYPFKVKLSDLRRIVPGFKPPYTYTIISELDPLYQLVISKLRNYKI